jgi:hypothetical protein
VAPFLKNIQKIFIIGGVIFLSLIIAGIYRFNFTNEDIYIENTEGEFVKYDEEK